MEQKNGIVRAVCISEKKGTPKKNINSCTLIEDFGLEGDAHAGSDRRRLRRKSFD